MQALLAETWRQLRQTRLAWAAGFLGVAGNVVLGVWLRRAARPAIWREPLRLWWENQQLPAAQLVFWGGGALLLFLLGWLLALRGEGTLMAIASGKDQPWQQGRRWLLRLVAIDTLVFLPLLLVSIVALVLLVALLSGSTLLALRSAEPRPALLGGWGLTLLCLTPILLLLVPLALLTLLVRSLAFRAATLEEVGARFALRRGWSLLRTRPGATALSALSLWGIAYIAGAIVSTFVLVLNLGTSLPELAIGRSGSWVFPVQLLLSLLAWPLRAALFAFLGLGWTHAYQGLVAGEPGR